MADVQVRNQADEIAVALVQALARQDADRVLLLRDTLVPLIQERPAMLARVATWTAQAHQINGDHESALEAIRNAIALVQQGDEPEVLPSLKMLKAEIVKGKAAIQAATKLPLPDSPLGRAIACIDQGEHDEGGRIARQARILAQSEGNYRDEVIALLTLARIPGQEDSAIRTAHEVADESNDKNLVTAVARAAKAAKVNLPTLKL